ncbi:MAG: aminodeoxychorismate synthase component I [Bacteroidota bacterium]
MSSLIHALPPHFTPLAVASALRCQPGFVWLDSARTGPYGRNSFIGCDPFLTFTAKADRLTLRGIRDEDVSGDPFPMLEGLLDQYRLPCGPRPLCGAAMGYFAYDLGRHLEDLPLDTLDDIAAPDLALGFYDLIYGYDHETGEAWVCSTGQGGDAQERLAQWLAWAQQEPLPRETGPASDGSLGRNFTKPEYLAALKGLKEYIAAGDIYQANLTQRFDVTLQVSPWELYLRLREINPAPFAAYLDLGGTQVASSSPERFLKLTGRQVETRPIKGTRPRGKTPEEDTALGQELLTSIKDNAELLMIVDLERNDLGRACKIGSVSVPELAVLESYETVHHLVATVLGQLDEQTSVVDLLRATFPGGSITGAPKIRSMEIIEELEPTQRSVYTGAIGYIGFDGDMDLNIVIRTIICSRGNAYFQVGGGIIADSDPESEYQETLDKGRALARALDITPDTFM